MKPTTTCRSPSGWPEANRSLDPPLYLTFDGAVGFLELKFHPETREVLGAVLVTAKRTRRQARRLSPRTSNAAATVRLVETAGASPRRQPLAGTDVYDDCIVIWLAAAAPTTWIGTPTVLFGLDESSAVVALCVLWGPLVRRMPLPDLGWPRGQNQSGRMSNVVRSRPASRSSCGPVRGSSQRKKYRAACRLPS